MSKRLTVIFDGVTVLDDVEVIDCSLNYEWPWQEVRSNPAMFAAMAGADAETLSKLPGEQVAWTHNGADIVITYRITAKAADATITEFEDALP